LDNNVKITFTGTGTLTNVDGDIFGVVMHGNGNATNSTVEISVGDGTLINSDGDIFGALLYSNTGTGDIVNATVDISVGGGTIASDNEITGGNTNGSGSISKSGVKITVASGTVTNESAVTGAISNSGSASSNFVDITVGDGGTFTIADDSEAYIMASSTDDGNALENRVNIKLGDGATFALGTNPSSADSYVMGANVSGDGTAEENSVSVTCIDPSNCGTFQAYRVFGAATQDGKSIKNTVGISAASIIRGDVIGGNSMNGAVEQNQVSLSGDVEIGGNVSGGSSYSNKTEGNTVSLNGGTVIDGDVFGGWTSTGIASGNTVNLNGDDHVKGTVNGGWADTGKADGNTVNLIGSSLIDGDVYGGFSVSGTADGNTVNMTGDVEVKGDVYGGLSTTGSADSNSVVLIDFEDASASSGNIYGGFSIGSSKGNNVSITNSTISKSIIAGYTTSSTADAVENSIYLGGNIKLANAAVKLSGGSTAGTGDSFTKNTLTLDFVDYSGGAATTFAALSDFDTINVNVATSVAMKAVEGAGGPPIIPVAQADLGSSSSPTVINTNMIGDGDIPDGAVLNMLPAGASTTGDAVVNLRLNFFNLVTTPLNNAQLTVLAHGLTDEAKVFGELPLADVSFVNRGSDLLAGQGIPSAMASAFGSTGVAAFATLGYGQYRTETGSHIDVKGLSGEIGAAIGTETSAGPFAVGFFLEFGDGSFDSYNEFAGVPAIHGEGDLSYIGGGLFARLDLGQFDSSHPYFEISARFGKTDADFKSRDISFVGPDFKFDMDAKYWGFHAGGGYVIDFKGNGFDATLDLSAKYFHTRRGGDDFLILGNRVNLSSVTSSRVKVGARLNAAITQTIKGYFGLYYEHEFDGDSRVTYGGVALPEATLKGSSAVGELGLIVSAPESPVEFQMGVQGSVGRRDGISGNLSVRYTF
jgi:hypothetical protein